MKIAVLSDTHLRSGEEAYELLWGHLHGVDLILHAGDVVAAEVIDALARIAPVQGVVGNMDLPEVRQRWPSRRVVQAGAFRIGLIHGDGAPRGVEPHVLRAFTAVDAVVFGHTHEPLVREHGGMLLINPGSACEPRWAPYPSYALIDADIHLRAEIVRLPR